MQHVTVSLVGDMWQEFAAEVAEDLSGWPTPSIFVTHDVAKQLGSYDPLDIVILLESGAATWVRVAQQVSMTPDKTMLVTEEIPPQPKRAPRGAWDWD